MLGALDQSAFPQLPLKTPSIGQDNSPVAQQLADFGMQDGEYSVCLDAAFDLPGSSDFLNDQEWDLSQNTIYGLFAPYSA